MSHVPPPHERPWRHPSELPAPPQEPVSTRARTIAIVGGTLGLVAIAMVALMVTPNREEVVAPSSSRSPGPAAMFTAPPASNEVVRVKFAATERIEQRWAMVRAGGTTLMWESAEAKESARYTVAMSAPGTNDRLVVVGDAELDVTLDDIGGSALEAGTLLLDERGELVAVIDERGDVLLLVADDTINVVDANDARD
ncbi:MAG: hypothetical protein H0X22_08190 [Acidimicrobiia bacterium]|nr:hypothetical protein [Acidimicrobiia bacterium]